MSIDSPFQKPECQDAITDVAVAIQGTVTYTPDADGQSGVQDAMTDYEFNATERYTSACLRALGFDGATADACHGMELLWAGAVSVSCTPVSAACECQFADARSGNDADTYTLDKAQLLLANSGAVSYCRTGDRLVEEADTESSRAVTSLHLVKP